jgi:hypothetical protein
MLGRTRARLRRRRGRVAVVLAIALLGVTVASAHTSIRVDHMSEAAAVCLAVLVGGTSVAAVHGLGGSAPRIRGPRESAHPSAPPRLQHFVPPTARGDPALLQVFRR